MSDTPLNKSAYAPGEHPNLPPPAGTTGIVGWVRKNLFSSPLNALLTLSAGYVLYLFLGWAWNWAIAGAVISGEDQTICQLGGSLQEYESNLERVEWDLLLAETVPSDPAAAAVFESDRTQSIKMLSRAESSLNTFNERVVALGDLVPGELAGIIGQVDPAGLGASLRQSIEVEDFATAKSLTEEATPLLVWGEGHSGACWVVIKQRFNSFLFSFYPPEEQWRVILAGALLILALAPVLFRVPYRRQLFWFTFAYPFIAYLLMQGVEEGDWLGFLSSILPFVPGTKWGGLTLTMITGGTGIAASLPLGILLALGRRSKMPIIRILCVSFIECIRGVPLITLLFMASNMLQLFLPRGVEFSLLLRALVVVALFASAYMAEVIRGGLQAIPKGQYEAAQAMGLSYWRMTRLVVMPQVLRITLPGIVNNFIGLFKDTTLLLTIGLFDFLTAARTAVTDAKWQGLAHEIYVFSAVVYFIICFGMSRYSLYLERKLHTGHKRR